MSLDFLSDKYRHIFDYLRTPPWPLRPYQNVYFMGFDAEWFESGNRNVVLSYQVATAAAGGSNNVIEYVEPGKRLTLADIVAIGVRSVNGGEIPGLLSEGRNVAVLISHHTTAEWSVLADRKEAHISRKLSVIRKSPVTGLHPFRLEIGAGVPFDVQLYDTRLLAPAGYQSLKKLSALLGSENDLKIDIPYFYKKRMQCFLKLKPARYREYALQDSAVTLKLFFLLTDCLIKLSGRTKLYKTLASGAVTGFLLRSPAFKNYLNAVKSSPYGDHLKLIRRGYHGGRNEGYLQGRSDRIEIMGNRLWTDVDFCGCYPSAMSLVPAVACGINPHALPFDPSKKQKEYLDLYEPPLPVRYLPLTYRLNDLDDDAIRAQGVTPEQYRAVKAILDGRAVQPDDDQDEGAKVLKQFDAELIQIARAGASGRRQARKLRELATVADNTLVNEWYQRWRAARRSGNTREERTIIPGIARVRFSFPKRTQYPCLAVPHLKYGLVYPLQGECVATSIEIITAKAAGARIQAVWSLEMPVQLDENGMPRRPFFEHLKDLIHQRGTYKKKIKNETLPPDERREAMVMEQLTKEYVNSFYGKTAQAINLRKSYGPSSGEMKRLGPSPISDPCTAALTTGLPRAALGAVLLAIERYNRGKEPDKQILVASATTDGLLVGLPRPARFQTADCYSWLKGKGLVLKEPFTNLDVVLKACGCSELMDNLLQYMPIRQMRNARLELTGKPVFLEVKNLADEIAAVKTRGQIGWIHYQSKRPAYRDGKAVTISAKFGHKPPLTDIVNAGGELEGMPAPMLMRQDQRYQRLQDGPTTDRNTVEGMWLLEQLDRLKDENHQGTEIFEYNFYGLTGFNEIMKSEDNDKDLVQKIGKRKFNGDFDWKRKLVLTPHGTVSPFTVPYRDITEMLAHRSQMQEERRWNRNAVPEKVLHRVKVRGRQSNNRGGEAAAVTRSFLRGVLQGKIPGQRMWRRVPERLNKVWAEQNLTMQKMMSKKKDAAPSPGAPRPPKEKWTSNDVENARRTPFEPQVIMPTLPLLNLVDALAGEFGTDAAKAKELIFAVPFDDEINQGLARRVARAVLQGPDKRIEPFRSLYLAGTLPDRGALVQAFSPYLTEAQVEECATTPFHAGEGETWDRPRVTRLFRRLGLSGADAEACARVVVLPGRKKDKLPSNPAHARCLESFVHALHQPDIAGRPIKGTEVLNQLRGYGLKRSQFYSLQHSKFAPRGLTDTAANRSQIKKMAKALRLDPAPFLDALLDR
ncbi:hypothetical protein [Geomonas propionica]|uniref:DNA-directed DNA polymerase n=1 Tax=Geomonas propionica TaxID=2798582 RepID=A0ABS0YPB2_9BACT|nr:hypothetical protein [Geomonas propionica]MBJ6799733.1 hypothetical protein [Geomonas propionica]